jgi:hypothetical protein
MNTLAIAFVCFVVGGVAAGIAQRRYYEALARSSDQVSSNAEVLDAYLGNLIRIPATSFRESVRRLRALRTRQPDRVLERMRWQALCAIAFSILAFLWIIWIMVVRT